MLNSTIKPNYKITHSLLSVAFPLSDWLFLVSLAGGAWAGAAWAGASWVFAFVSPRIARTSDTYKQSQRITISANRFTRLHVMINCNTYGKQDSSHNYICKDRYSKEHGVTTVVPSRLSPIISENVIEFRKFSVRFSVILFVLQFWAKLNSNFSKRKQ